MTDDELIEHLRKAAGIWFKNSDLLLLEELIKRYRRVYSDKEAISKTASDYLHQIGKPAKS